MPDYSSILQKITHTQKMRILADIQEINHDEYRALGIPAIRFADVEQGENNSFFNADVLAKTWNRSLMEQAAQEHLHAMLQTGADVVCVPSPAVRIGIVSSAHAEDAMLTVAVTQAYCHACRLAGIPYIINGICLDTHDMEWMGAMPDVQTIGQTVLNPLRFLDTDGDTYLGVFVNGNLEDAVCSQVYHTVQQAGHVCFCKNVTDTQAVSLIQRGFILLNGNGEAIENAVERYETVQKSIALGKDTVKHLHELTNQGKAVSPQVVDEAVLRSIETAFRIAHIRTFDKQEFQAVPNVEKQLWVESGILLRNRNVLPLTTCKALTKNTHNLKKKVKKVYIVTDTENQMCLRDYIAQKTKWEIISIAGYDGARCDGDVSRMNEVISAISDGDIIIVCLSVTDSYQKKAITGGHRKLPANQLLLAKMLRSLHSKTVMIVFSDMPFDTELLYSDALLWMPKFVPSMAETVGDILLGDVSPSGKLPVSLYGDSDGLIQKRSIYLNRYALKTGPFYGYRTYTDTGLPTDEYVNTYSVTKMKGFAFGHGLTYAAVTYSNLKVKDKNVCFCVKNNGHGPVKVKPQVYIAVKQAPYIFPERELCGYTEILLNKGERKNVTVQIQYPWSAYQNSSQAFTIPTQYDIWVGESYEDTPLHIRMAHSAHNMNALKPALHRHQYLMSESNIKAEGYTLEAYYTMKKRNPKNLILGLILLCLAGGVRYICSVMGISDIVANGLSVILLACAVVSFIFDIIDRNKDRNRMVKEIETINDKFFSTAKTIEIENAASLFADDDEQIQSAYEQPLTQVQPQIQTVDTAFGLLDLKLSFETVVVQFIQFAGQCGYAFSEDTVRAVFSAFASSHIVVLYDMQVKEAEALYMLLCQFWGTETSVMALSDTVRDENDLLCVQIDGVSEDSPLLTSIQNATVKKDNITVCRITDVISGEGINALIPFIRFAQSPFSVHKIEFTMSNGTLGKVILPPNFYLLLDASGQNSRNLIKNMPAFLLQTAAFLSCSFKTMEPVEKIGHSVLTYTQMRFMSEKAQDALKIAEDNWKKMDSVIRYIAENTSADIDVHLPNRIEQYAAVYLAAGGEEEKALDNAYSAYLMPYVVNVVLDKLSPESEKPDSMVDRVFGEDNAPLCLRIAKMYSHFINLDTAENGQG